VAPTAASTSGRGPREVHHQRRRLLGAQPELRLEGDCLLRASDEHHSVAGLCTKPASTGQLRREPEPVGKEDRRSEHDEAGQERVAQEELHERDGRRACERGADGGTQHGPLATGKIRQPEAVRAQAQDRGIRDSPAEAAGTREVVVADVGGVHLGQPEHHHEDAEVHHGPRRAPHVSLPLGVISSSIDAERS